MPKPKKLLSVATLTRCVTPPLPGPEVRALINTGQIAGYRLDTGIHAGAPSALRQLQRLVCRDGRRRPVVVP